MTDPAAGEDSPAPRRRPRRRHPAFTSRIAVTGISAATMFGIVAALGVAGASQDSTSSPGTLPAPDPTPTAPLDPRTTTEPTPMRTTVPVTELSAEPIQLTANPVVRIVETPAAQAAPAAPTQQEPAPVASTNGSR